MFHFERSGLTKIMTTMLFFIKHPTLKACIGLEDGETTLANFIKQWVFHNVAFAIYIKKKVS
jgi:hypothetical protein